MSELENFLNRWSRRKAAANDQPAELGEKPAPAVAPDTGAHPSESEKAGEKMHSDAATPPAHTEKSEPEFDLSTLPPIESIEAGTDVTAFLRAGVPTQLTRAALRRAWAADPTIRDFIGLSENSWDFTADGAMPGFGPLSPDEASRLMAQYTAKVQEVARSVAGKVSEANEAIERIGASEPPKTSDAAGLSSKADALPLHDGRETQPAIASDQETQGSSADSVTDQNKSLQRGKENVATQNELPRRDDDPRPTPRLHGGALPK